MRKEEELGIVEFAEFFGPDSGRLFGFRHLPVAQSIRGGVLICSPLLAEFRQNYRREFELGRQLAADGLAVQRFHYSGTGNSDGDSADVSMSSLEEDALMAASRLRETTAASVTVVVGTRLGALVAVRVARRLGVRGVVLWDPTIDTDSYFRDAFRARRLRNLREGTPDLTSRQTMISELQTQGRVDVLGYTIHSRLYESVSGIDFRGWSIDPVPMVLLVQLGRTVRRGCEEVIARWRSMGAHTDIRVIPSDDPWWLVGGADREGDGPSLGPVEATRSWIRTEGVIAP